MCVLGGGVTWTPIDLTRLRPKLMMMMIKVVGGRRVQRLIKTRMSAAYQTCIPWSAFLNVSTQ